MVGAALWWTLCNNESNMASQLKHLDHCIRTILCPHRQLISQRTYATLKTLTRNVQHADLEGTGVGGKLSKFIVK